MPNNPSKQFVTTPLKICFLEVEKTGERGTQWIPPRRCAQDVHTLSTLWLLNLDSCGFIMYCFDRLLLHRIWFQWKVIWVWDGPIECLKMCAFRFYSMISHAIALVSVHVFENNNGTTFIRMVEVVRLIVTETMANIYIYVCMYVCYIYTCLECLYARSCSHPFPLFWKHYQML